VKVVQEIYVVPRKRSLSYGCPVIKHLVSQIAIFFHINQKISFKVLAITFMIINGYAPTYLSSLLESYKPKRALRSATKRLLRRIPFKVPAIRAKLFTKNLLTAR